MVRVAGVEGGLARMTVALDSLRALPVGAGYRCDSGRAHASVRMGAGGRIVVAAECDSVAAVAEYYEREMARMRMEAAERDFSERREVGEETERGGGGGWRWGAIGLVLGMALGLALGQDG